MRKFIFVLITTMLFTTGCAHWSDADRLAFGFACAGQGADLWTTARNFRAGAHEQILPWDDIGSQALFRVALLGGAVLLGEMEPQNREGIFMVLGILGGSAAAYNQYAYDKERP